MPTPAAYITASDLAAALGAQVYMQIFDDASTGDIPTVDASAQVELVIERAHSEVLSYVPAIYESLPTSIPTLLKSAELDYAVALSLERHPEYVRAYGEEAREKRWMRAEKKMGRIVQSIQQITDGAPAGRPGNVGGVIRDTAPRVMVDGPDGTHNGGDFA